MMLQSLARGTMLRRSIAAISATRSAALAASTMTRAMGSVTYSPPAAKIGKPAPDFTAGAVIDGEITKLSLSDYRGKYVALLFYPKDHTFVCPTEIIAYSDAYQRFEEVGTKVIGISTDTEESHLSWIRTPRKKGGLGHMQIPLVADVTKTIAADYGVLLEDIGIALRGTFLIDPEGVLQQITMNNLPVGRNVDETIRLIQAFQFVAKHGEVCPAGWKPGDKTMKADPEGSLEYFASGATEGIEADPLAGGPHVVTAKSGKHLKELLAKKGKVVLDFVAGWCGKCKQIMPFVNELSEMHAGEVTFVKVDTTEEALAEVVAEHGVSVLPAFHFFKDGKPFGAPIVGYKKTPLKDSVAALAKK
ncbi:hypothetical protein VYU27_002293 [Nannochloropsis oceanica]